MHAPSIPVDMTLAHTYVPAISCILKATAFILLVANTSAILYPPILMGSASVLMIDRIVRAESIFDSNAVLCTILASYVIDSIRIQHEQVLLFHGQWGAKWLVVASFACMGVSVMLILDIPWMQVHNASTVVHKSWTLVMQIFALFIVSQTPLQDEHRAEHDHIMIRSFAFLCLAILWTYTVGIRNMVELLNSTTRIPTSVIMNNKSEAKRGTHSIVVQSFIPCLMRFAGVLLTSGWPQTVFTLASAAAMAARLAILWKKSENMTHPEYCTQNSLDPCTPQADYAQLVLQQDIRHAGSTHMSIRSTPLILNQQTDSVGSPPPQQTPDQTGSKTDRQQQATPQKEDEEFYSMFALAKQQAAGTGSA